MVLLPKIKYSLLSYWSVTNHMYWHLTLVCKHFIVVTLTFPFPPLPKNNNNNNKKIIIKIMD